MVAHSGLTTPERFPDSQGRRGGESVFDSRKKRELCEKETNHLIRRTKRRKSEVSGLICPNKERDVRQNKERHSRRGDQRSDRVKRRSSSLQILLHRGSSPRIENGEVAGDETSDLTRERLSLARDLGDEGLIEILVILLEMSTRIQSGSGRRPSGETWGN